MSEWDADKQTHCLFILFYYLFLNKKSINIVLSATMCVQSRGNLLAVSLILFLELFLYLGMGGVPQNKTESERSLTFTGNWLWIQSGIFCQ